MIPQQLPDVGPGRLAVRFEIEDPHQELFQSIPGGTRGRAAIYTEHLALIEIVRKVIIRLESKFDYIVFKMPGMGH
jgi:hypothetical protein